MATSSQGGRPRKPALEVACMGTWRGTEPILRGVIDESKGAPAWRPMRAAMLMAKDPAPPDHVWMTTEEFLAWVDRNTSRGGAELEQLVGINPHRRRALKRGERVSKTEALAMAHHGAGLPVPVAPGDVIGFRRWVLPRFGAVRSLSAAVDVGEQIITERMRGYIIRDDRRVERRPDVQIIRALDWVWRVGAVSPYGQRLGEHPFPLALGD